jgi:hypothetical protein
VLSPLHFTVGYGHTGVNKQLLTARCNVDLQQEEWGRQLHCAAENGHETVTKLLIGALCSVDLQIKGGTIPAGQRHEAVTKQVIALGMRPS